MSLLTFIVTSYTFYYQYISYFWPVSGSPYTVAVYFILTSKCACVGNLIQLLPNPDFLVAFQICFHAEVAIWVISNRDVPLLFGKTETIYTYRNCYQKKHIF